MAIQSTCCEIKCLTRSRIHSCCSARNSSTAITAEFTCSRESHKRQSSHSARESHPTTDFTERNEAITHTSFIRKQNISDWLTPSQLPTTLYLPPLPPQIEELWVRRDTVSRNLRGAKAWVKFFNDDVVYMRITGDTEAEAYAKWGEPYLEQSVAIDIPKFTLEMHKIEEAMVTCMKGM